MVLTRRALGLSISVLAVTSCATATSEHETPDALGDDAVTVGSFDFAESELLAEIYSQALEQGGVEVQRSFGLGPREFVVPALARGLVELVPEYAGTALQFLDEAGNAPDHDTATTHAALARILSGSDIEALQPALAQNTNTFVVTSETAAQHDLRRLSDLAAVAPDLTFGGPPECATRPLCLAGLESVYGIRFSEVVSLDAGGPLTHQALTNRDVDVALLFSTDPAVVSGEVVELVDDRNLQPAENVTPLVRTEVIDRWGDDVVPRLDAVSERLTTAMLRDLNAEVAGGREAGAVAGDWLSREGLG